jgi:hypothetical protein
LSGRGRGCGGTMVQAALLRSGSDGRVLPLEAERGQDVDLRPATRKRQGPLWKSYFAHYARRPLAALMPFGVGATLAAVTTIGWLNRDEGYLAPDIGAGYWLGIVGATLMLLLLLYPLRKRMRASGLLGSVALWFRLHMILGLIGPLLILFHANFQLGSLNSNVAMAAMLLVAGSGIFGRYLYSKIHLGLYGRKAEVRSILADAEALKELFGDALPVADHMIGQMNEFTKHAMESSQSFTSGLRALPFLGIRARLFKWRLLREVRRSVAAEATQRGWSRRKLNLREQTVSEIVTLHIAAVKKAAAFQMFDRLFSLWHVLHLPLFIILILAACIHVAAVHFY